MDFGLGATLIEPGGKTRRTWLFRAVLSHSRKGYSEVVLRQDTEMFLRVIENAVRYFGGVPRLLNFDNLKAAVVKADWYDPAMNPKLADFCRHNGMTPMPCRSHTPEHGVGYAKNNTLKGRQFASLGEQKAHLLHWEEQVEPGKFSRSLGVRGLHGTIKESADCWRSRAAALGEAAGRWAQRALDACGAEALRSIMGLCLLADKRRAADVNAACAKATATPSITAPS